jgi:hypothetical protein
MMLLNIVCEQESWCLKARPGQVKWMCHVRPFMSGGCRRRSAFGLPLPSLPFPRPPAPPAEALKQLSDIAWRASELLPELGSLR